MTYLIHLSDIRSQIIQLVKFPILWVDTEVADWYTPKPRLSLIQVLSNPADRTGETTYLFDVLDQPDAVQFFIHQIMMNQTIEKVFHNASFDLKYLGGKQAQNITCTLKLARQIPKNTLKASNCKLKTLAIELCHFTAVDIAEQQSDWGKRPLSAKQLLYAKMDTVYLAHVHQALLKLKQPSSSVVSMPTPSPARSFSVTQIRVAFECPRLFYLAHHFNGKTLFLPSGKTSGIGSAFHDLSHQFIQTALNDSRFSEQFDAPVDQLDPEAISTQLQTLFFDQIFYQYLQSVTQASPAKAPALLQLWEGLKSLIHRWVKLLVNNRRYCSPSELFHKTFLAQELTVQHQFALPNGTSHWVKGRLDSLIYDFEHHRLCVVEYKTYQSPDRSAQLAQVALYSYMLREKIGVPINSAVYAVLPDWQESVFNWNDLEQTVHQLIPHKLQQMAEWVNWQPGEPNPPPPTAQLQLCEMCPQQTRCQTFFTAEQPDLNSVVVPIQPVSPKVRRANQHAKNHINTSANPQRSLPTATAQSADPRAPQAIADANSIGSNLIEILNSFGIGATYQGSILAPAFIRVKLKPNPGVKVNSLLKLSDDLRVQLGLTHPPLIAPQAGYVSVDLPRTDRQVAQFEQYLQPQPSLQSPGSAASSASSVSIAIGVDLDGQLVEADLSDPNTCHFLVGGTTGSGKSEFLRSLLLSLLMRHAPEQLQIALVDPKRVTFPEFERMRWLHKPIVKDGDGAIDLMNALVAEMDSRYQQLEQAGCADLTSYNQRQAKPMPRIVCIFDEYADFMAEKETRAALESSIKRLGAMARAAGIHLIIATQRPEARVVTPLIRSNLPGRVALRTASEADSAIILGGKQTEAAYLLGKGDLLFYAGASRSRLQSLYAPTIQLPAL